MADYVFLQENATVHSFLENTDYSNDPDYTETNVTEYIQTGVSFDDPAVLSLPVPSGATKIVVEDEWEESVSGSSYDVSNLIPFKSHIYSFKNSSNETIESGTIVPNGKMRMIFLNGAHNCRDIGGWKCAGGNVKYGMIYRSGELQNNTAITISGNDAWRLRDQCGVLCELDFRGSSETDGGTPDDPSDDYTTSVLGSDIEYVNIPMAYYKTALTTSAANTVRVLKTLFTNVENNKPTIFHCQAGADRTGTIAFLIGAILGMSQSDLDKDFELTALSGVYGNQTRTRLNSYYLELVEYVKSFGEDTYEKNVIKWATSNGISAQEINTFRKNMIDGIVPDYPSDYTITYNLKNVVSSNSDMFAADGGVYLSKIASISPEFKIRKVSITMGGVDITSQAWLGTEIFEDKVVITEQYLTDIANAIRSKLQNSKKYYPKDMANAISSISGSGTAYTITKNLIDGVTIDNSISTISENASYIANITTNKAINVTITMGGSDVSSYYKDGTITIPKVTGDIVITIVAEQYVNQIPISKDASGNTYNTTGYKEGYRLNSSANETEMSGYFITGYIPFTLGKTIMVDKFSGSESSNGGIWFFDSNHSVLSGYRVARMITDGVLVKGETMTFVPSETVHDGGSGNMKDITNSAYIRLSIQGSNPSEAICNVY